MPVPSPADDGPTPSALVWGMWTLAALGVVACAWLLGATWLAGLVLGVPVGLWMVGLGLGVAGVLAQRWPGLTCSDLRIWLTPACWRVADAMTRSARWMLERIVGEHRTYGIEKGVCAWLDRMPWWVSPLRIGLDLSPGVGRALAAAPGLVRVRWLEINGEAARDDANAFCEKHGLDAVVFALPAGGLRIVTLRRAGRDAALPDWSLDRPVTLGTLFQYRVDPGVVEIGPCSARLQRACLEAAAVLARLPSRLNMTDRLAGRRPVSSLTGGRELRPFEHAQSDTPAQVMASLLAAAQEEGISASAPARLAARAASAWAATPVPNRRVVDEHARREVLESVCQAMPGDLASHLRLGAARFAALDDSGGLDQLAMAYEVLREQRCGRDCTVDAAFLEEALLQSPDDSASVGRVAAGLTLLIGATPPDQLDYLRDDLLDEARFADWLIGRDPDTRLLDQVFRRLRIDAGPITGHFPRRAA